MPFRVSLNAPLVPTLASFAHCAEPLQLHLVTAQILDDMRFLIGLVLALPDRPSDKEVQKVRSTSAWFLSRICNLPQETTAARQNDLHTIQVAAVEPLQSPQAASCIAQTSSAATGSPHDESSVPEPSSRDLMYQAVRRTALVYSRAIAGRRSLRDPSVCSQEEFNQAWTTVWRVPMRDWRRAPGVFAWVALGLAPASHGSPHERFLKSLLSASLLQMGQEDWEVTEKVIKNSLRLVQWLTGGEGAGHSG